MFLSGSRDLASGSESQPDSAAADGASRGDQLRDWAIYVIGLSHSWGGCSLIDKSLAFVLSTPFPSNG